MQGLHDPGRQGRGRGSPERWSPWLQPALWVIVNSERAWSCAIWAQHLSSHGTCSAARNGPVTRWILNWLNWRKNTFPCGLKNTWFCIKFLLYLTHLIAFTLMNTGCKCIVCWWIMVWVGLKWAFSKCECNQSWLHKALGTASPGLCAETGTL